MACVLGLLKAFCVLRGFEGNKLIFAITVGDGCLICWDIYIDMAMGLMAIDGIERVPSVGRIFLLSV